ncbi:MAG TPA: methyltransferase [Candidatus Paceibacterota bacterium]|nr:methyltransferase [Candidatus Paceibacterota bacterium]
MAKNKADQNADFFMKIAMMGMFLSAFCSQTNYGPKTLFGNIFLAVGVFLVLYCQYYHIKHYDGLITTGPYRYTRHPMYTSILIANFALLWTSIPPITDKIFYIGQAILVLGMASCWFFEEQAMLAKYGLLAREYYARTPRLFFMYPVHRIYRKLKS